MDDYNNPNNNGNGMPNGQPDYREQYNNTYGANSNQNNNYSQPDYNQQYGGDPQVNQYDYNPQQYPTYNDAQPQKNDGKAVASLVLGIVGLVLFCCCAGIYCSIPGLILGIVSKKSRPQNNGIATAGIVLSAIGVAVLLFYIIYYIAVGFSITNYNDIWDYYSYY